jgi:predicted membrane protein
MRPLQALLNDLKQVLWAICLIYLILASTCLLFAQYIGFKNSFLICAAIATLIAAAFISIYLCNIIWFIADRRAEKKQHVNKD